MDLDALVRPALHATRCRSEVRRGTEATAAAARTVRCMVSTLEIANGCACPTLVDGSDHVFIALNGWICSGR